jgi:hypothetical protein
MDARPHRNASIFGAGFDFNLYEYRKHFARIWLFLKAKQHITGGKQDAEQE